MTYATEQEAFWAGEFGEAYIDRNNSERLMVANIALFRDLLRSAPGVGSILELGCNIGLNLRALNVLSPRFAMSGYEINDVAADKARALGIADIISGSILDPLPTDKTYDLTFTKTVLIHIHPDQLDKVYANLVDRSRRYIAVCEYYNPTPVTIPYRGNTERLFKRDFAGELIDRYGLQLVSYGFAYHRDPYHPQDDITWFLLEKP